jgi:heterodisulfide reductase subunit B
VAKYALYPGCSMETGGIEYAMSSEAVAEALGIEFLEVPDWNCCGASSAHMTDHLLSLALPARIMALAETLPVTELVAPCAACHARMAAVEYELGRDNDLKEKVNSLLERPYTGKIKLRYYIDIFSNSDTLSQIEKKVKKPLKGLKVACYYLILLYKIYRFMTSQLPAEFSENILFYLLFNCRGQLDKNHIHTDLNNILPGNNHLFIFCKKVEYMTVTW